MNPLKVFVLLTIACEILGQMITYPVEIIHEEKIEYPTIQAEFGICTKSRRFDTNNKYDHRINFDKDYELVSVEYAIPFLGLNAASRDTGRLLLYFDTELIYEATIVGVYFYVPIVIKGYKANVNKGEHRIRLLGAVYNGNEFYFPYKSSNTIESTISAISTTMLVLGYNSNPTANSGFDLIFDSTIEYPNAIKVASTKSIEIQGYTKEFTVSTNYRYINIEYRIPNVGLDIATKRARIFLDLDEEVICDATAYYHNTWQLNTILLQGHKSNLSLGKHVIKVFAFVDGGTLHIPMYNSNGFTSTQPKMTAQLLVIGFK